MPIACDPDSRAPFSLRIDAKKPEAERPKLILRFMTRREHDQVARLRQQAVDETDDSKCWDLMKQALSIGVVGASNVTTPDGKPWKFSIEGLPEVFSDVELWEIMHNYPRSVRVTEIDLGKSISQRQSEPAPSASDATPAASTSRQNSPPSSSRAGDATPPSAAETAAAAAPPL